MRVRWSNLDLYERVTLAILGLICLGAIVHARQYFGQVPDVTFSMYGRAYGVTHSIAGVDDGPRAFARGWPSAFQLLLALVLMRRVDVYPLALGLGVLALLCCVVAAHAIVRIALKESIARLLGLCAATLVAASPLLALRSQTGDDAILYACGIAVGTCLFLRTILENVDSVSWVIALAFAALIRPGSIGVFIAYWALGAVLRKNSPEPCRRRVREAVIFTSITGGWLLLCVLLEGPAVLGLAARALGEGIFPQGLWHLSDATLATTAKSFLSCVSDNIPLCILIGGCVIERRLRFVASVVLVLITGSGGWRVLNGTGDPETTLAVIVPAMAIVALGIRGYLFHADQHLPGGRWPSYVIVGLAVIWTLDVVVQSPIKAAPTSNLAAMREFGRRLAPLTRADDWAVSEAPHSLSYYWGIRSIDTTADSAAPDAQSQKPESARKAAEYVASKQPPFVVMNNLDATFELYKQSAFAPHRDDYYLVQFPSHYLSPIRVAPPSLLVRKDRREVGELAQRLGVRLVDLGRELRRLGFDA